MNVMSDLAARVDDPIPIALIGTGVYGAHVAYQIEEGLSELYVVFDFTEWGTEERVFWKLR